MKFDLILSQLYWVDTTKSQIRPTPHFRSSPLPIHNKFHRNVPGISVTKNADVYVLYSHYECVLCASYK